MAQTADGAVLATGLQSQDTESLGNDHLLLLIVGGRDTLEDLEALQSGGTAGGLVRNHTTDGLVEDSGGGAEVEGTWTKTNSLISSQHSQGGCWSRKLTTAGGVVSGHLAQVGVVLDCSKCQYSFSSFQVDSYWYSSDCSSRPTPESGSNSKQAIA